MKFFFAGLVLILIIGITLFVLHDPYPSRFKHPVRRSVYLAYQNNKYTLYRFGKPFFIKGAAGITHLKELNEAGGNTIRTWDTAGLDSILANAQKNNIAVIVGLPMSYNDDMDEFYNNEAKVQALLKRYKEIIIKYRTNKAILFWCLGNELAYPVKPRFYKFYSVFNRFVDMIHQEDPDHPVTTTLINFEKQYILNIKLFTHIDFISFNIFGAIRHLKQDLANFKRLWSGPYMITEWAIDGPWPGHDQTAWGAFIEATSDKKADSYRELYQKYMPLNDPRFLGSMSFYWGYKQETTPTWFSMFDKAGRKSASVNVMQYVWTGKWPTGKAPSVKYMLLDEKGAKDNLLYNPGVRVNARVLLADTTQVNGLQFEWFVQPEDWFRVQHFYNQKEKASLTQLTILQQRQYFSFRTPQKEGPYRVYVYIYNNQGYFATCNTPFYVVGAK